MKATKQRWANLCAALDFEPDLGEFVRLESAYSQSHRAYHTLQHLSECLEKLDWAASNDISRNIALAEMALWYHDAVYRTRATDNELKSAEWAYRFLTTAGVEAKDGKLVHSLILATRHDEMPKEPAHQLVVDIDLSILGAAPTRFEEYEEQVRVEYNWAPWFMYRRKRREILQYFLDRPCIYNTELFYAEYEHRARENLKRSVERLR